MANWVIDLDTNVYNRFKNELNKRYTKDTLYFTISDRTPSKAQFPTVYFHTMQNLEEGSTLEGTDINAVLYSAQIEVTVVKDQTQAKKIMAEVINSMKTMLFEVIALPEITSTTDTYKAVARFRRLIGASDRLAKITSAKS